MYADSPLILSKTGYPFGASVSAMLHDILGLTTDSPSTCCVRLRQVDTPFIKIAQRIARLDNPRAVLVDRPDGSGLWSNCFEAFDGGGIACIPTSMN